MRVTELAELAAFDAVARHRSFRKAGEERGVTASALSHAVSNLEERIGVRLLNRTTRSVSLTDAGGRLHQQLSPAFDGIGLAVDGLNQFRDTPFGKVRLNVPNSIAPFVVGPILQPLTAANRNLEIEVVATDRLVDIAEAGFDAGIRLGESLREGMVAVRIKPRLRLIVIGSPAYFAERPVPQTPHDLKDDHVGIQNMYPNGNRYAWGFRKGSVSIDYWPAGPISLDDHELIVQAARAGAGLGYVWEQRAQSALTDGSLIQCLDDWCQPEDWLYLYYPSRRNLSAGLRAVIEAMRV
ncbi:LysR family transcriptional regulator [Mesorhizobium sp. MSK_1335]|uniref:LysR family transcriptional regulator n=1 Tax=Mesorhizobium montanum TaxID=3072323 RepID=A0ABU4ZIQ8_9HYPH|nr:LysR family transcriptional regulator [Mesorhizobium sp. MSK_1335]MDX8525256.1 LysR family transcriptional regulator [Mesorhizobium sp. MSK_1335]